MINLPVCTHRYGVQVASALVVFILMWILLATLDDGLKDPKHFDPGTKTTFWVCVQGSACECALFMAKHYLNFIRMQVLALIVVVFGFIFTLPFQIFVREKSNVNLKKLKWYRWLQNPQFYLVITVEWDSV